MSSSSAAERQALINNRGGNQYRSNWSKEEDRVLMEIVQARAKRGQWRIVAEQVCARVAGSSKKAKCCRERWTNHLDPSVNNDPWTQNEIEIYEKHIQEFGKRWSEISKRLSGRTDHAIKNRFYSEKRKTQRQSRKANKRKRSSIEFDDDEDDDASIEDSGSDDVERDDPSRSAADDAACKKRLKSSRENATLVPSLSPCSFAAEDSSSLDDDETPEFLVIEPDVTFDSQTLIDVDLENVFEMVESWWRVAERSL